MVWFYDLGTERRSCETRLAPEGEGYELVIEDSTSRRTELFKRYRLLLAREHELLTGWRAEGWTVRRPAERAS
jgi:hypothetical protein